MSIEYHHRNRCGREFSTRSTPGRVGGLPPGGRVLGVGLSPMPDGLGLRVIANDLTDPKEEA